MGPLLVVVFFSAVLLAVLFLDAHPEFDRAQADDGLFLVEGNVPSTVDIHVTKDLAASTQSWTAVASGVYVVEPDGILLPAPVTVQLLSAGYEETSAYAIGFFDTQQNVWVPVDTTRDEERGVFEARTNHFSHWALLKKPTVNMYDTDREALLADVYAMMPVGTTGYTVDIAYATVDADFVLLEEEVDRRVCSKPVAVRDKRVQTVSDKSVSLRVDGVERSGTVRAVIHWDIGSGCSTLIRPQAIPSI